MAGDGNGDGGDVAARPGPRGSVERKRGLRRSLWASRGSEGGPVAVVAVDGGDERARAREGESREGSRGRERVRERSEGAAWRHPKRPGRSGKQEVAGAASALATELLRGEGEEEDRRVAWWAGPATWAAR